MIYRLTGNRVDEFSRAEMDFLALSSNGLPIWLVRQAVKIEDESRCARKGDGQEIFEAAFELQRLGYVAPTVHGRPATEGRFALGWKITLRGIEALSIAIRRMVA